MASKHINGDQVVEKLTLLTYELNKYLRLAPEVNVKANVDTIDRDSYTVVLLTIGKR